MPRNIVDVKICDINSRQVRCILATCKRGGVKVRLWCHNKNLAFSRVRDKCNAYRRRTRNLAVRCRKVADVEQSGIVGLHLTKVQSDHYVDRFIQIKVPEAYRLKNAMVYKN